jgi:3-isopropylmalate dehydrogenase
MSGRPLRVTVLPGDGIGPEVTAAAVEVLRAVAPAHGLDLQTREALLGGAAIDACGEPFPDATRAACAASDAVLLGAVGGPKWDGGAVRPEQGLLGIRKVFGLYANLRPVRPIPAVAERASPLRPERLAGVDLLFVRELTGGIYFGAKERTAERARDDCVYTVAEVERVVRRAATLATQRRGRLTSVDKANVLETSRLWREVTSRVVRDEFPGLVLEHLLVDAMAMHLLARARDFDVVVTENLFGDVLTDEASMLAGSLGMLPSASLGDGGFGLYEPVHGSAPEIAGRGLANPYAAILSAALLLRHSAGAVDAAAAIEAAVEAAVGDGVWTPDLGGAATTRAATAAVLDRLAGSTTTTERRAPPPVGA